MTMHLPLPRRSTAQPIPATLEPPRTDELSMKILEVGLAIASIAAAALLSMVR